MRLNDALDVFDLKGKGDAPVPFDVAYVSCNRSKKTGGKIERMTGVVKTGLPWSMKETFMIGIKVPGSKAKPVAIHNRLIIEVNGEPVFY